MTQKTTEVTKVKAWLTCIRPPTWGVAIAPVLMGLAFALVQSGSLNWPVALATLLVSVMMQTISNMENDAGYTKRKAERGNRKGLPRATANGWLTVRQVETAIGGVAFLAALDTCYLIYHGGFVFFGLLLASTVAAYCYMGGSRPIAYTPCGELMVFIFFGLVAVCGTYYLQTLELTPEILLGACAAGCVAANVLVVNNTRDIEHDASVNRRTLAVTLGRSRMLRIYKVLLFLPFALLIAAALLDHRLFGLVAVVILVPQALELAEDIKSSYGDAMSAIMFGTIKMEMKIAFLTTAVLAATRLLQG
ncbi:MAG: 1,4-dihydroxy-2-naphthoate octaprenyltransferase [Duodenibacillus sp.]|nr:1,4-dihydroxy-2-naphthoate octaprenyltransferase [Duodenibacillus sp.]